MSARFHGLFTGSFLLVSGTLLSASTEAGIVDLSLTVDQDSQTWQLFAEISDTTVELEPGNGGENAEILGIAFFDLNVVGHDGLTVTSSQVEAPQGQIGTLAVSGFRFFRSNGNKGLHITSAQDTITNPILNPEVVLEGVGLFPGSDDFGASWDFPALLASGTYAGEAGELTASDVVVDGIPGMTLLYGDPALGFVNISHVTIASTVNGSTAILDACIAGDVNCDGRVELTDFSILKENFGQGATRAQGDLSGDGVVNLTDFSILKESFGNMASVAAVPEPSAWLCAVFAIVGVWPLAQIGKKSRR